MTSANSSTAARANPWLPHLATIVDVIPEIPGVATYRLRLNDPALAEHFAYEPGQFNMLYLPGFGESAISLSGAARNGGDLIHTIRVAGNVTRQLSQLRAGDSLGVRGPYGTSWPLAACAGRDVVLVAGGIGLAPLRPAVYELMQRRRDFGQCTVVLGGRSPDLLLYEREFASWREAGLNVLTTVDRASPGWNGAVGVVTLLLDRFQPLVPERTSAFICGPDVMMRYAVASIARRGVTMDQIWLSLERNMQCAVGLCGHCQFGPTFVCRDGPVFRADRIEPLMHVSHL